MDQVHETRKLAAKAIREMLDELDVHADYQVFTGNKDYSEETQGVRFVSGRADIAGLPADADEDEVLERELALKWFLNCEPKEITVRVTYDEDRGTRTPVYGWRLAYRLEKSGGGKRATKKEAVTAA